MEVDPAIIGDTRATKSDLEVDPAVSDAPGKSSRKRDNGYCPKSSGNKSEEYKKTKTKKKKNKGKWINNKKMKRPNEDIHFSNTSVTS